MIDVVCGVIENAAGEFLACRRPLGKHLGGLWEFPGGKVDPKESPENALVRELREELRVELRVEVEVGVSMKPVLWTYDDKAIRLLPFRCRIAHGIPQAVEHEAILWCRPEKFGELCWADADIPVIREIFPDFGQ
ncbi:MAG: (deoxy)nucleoside triphosphate pyrophosphohydrolase [Verrucomicrobiota bacterium]